MVDRYLGNLLRPRVFREGLEARVPLGPHTLVVEKTPLGVRATVDMPVPRGLRALRGPGGPPESTEAGEALLALHEVNRMLSALPELGLQVREGGLAAWRYDNRPAVPPRLGAEFMGSTFDPYEPAALVERAACFIDPWLVADPERPWESVLGPGLSDLAVSWDERGGMARAQLRARDLEGELRVRPVSAERFDLELELELEEEAVDEPLRASAASFPFRTLDRVQARHAGVDDAFYVEGETGERIFRALMPALAGWIEFGGRGFDLEITRAGLHASARVERALVPRWAWTMADACRLAADGFHRAGPAEFVRRWFAPLPSSQPTGVEIELGAPAASSWRRAASALGREVGALPGGSRVFRGDYDLVGKVGDHDLVLSLRSTGEALFLATCVEPPEVEYSDRASEHRGELGEAAALLDRWRGQDIRFHLRSDKTHSDLKRARPGVGVLRLFVQRLPARELRSAWRTLESLVRLYDPGCDRSAAEHFLAAVDESEIELTPEGVSLQGSRARLFWGEPWHALHAPWLRLYVERGGRPDAGPIEHGAGAPVDQERLRPALVRFRDLGTGATFHYEPQDDGFYISVRAYRARLHESLAALALAWKLSLGA